MDKKKIRTKYFSLKELRLSVAHMVLWSILVVAFFTYITIELGEKIEHNPVYLIIVFFGYAAIVFVLTMIFTHRFIGPFERLKTELRIILAGNYHRRLSIRSRDDLYIRSFILEVNRVPDHLEKSQLFKEEFCNKIDSELSTIKSLIEREEIPIEKLREAVISFRKKIGLKDDKKL